MNDNLHLISEMNGDSVYFYLISVIAFIFIIVYKKKRDENKNIDS